MLLDTATEGNLLADVCAGGAGEDKLGSIVLDGSNLGTGGGRTNVHHENLVLSKLGDLGLLTIGGSNTEKTTEKIEIDLNLTIDLRESTLKTKNKTNKTIGSAESGVDTGSATAGSPPGSSPTPR